MSISLQCRGYGAICSVVDAGCKPGDDAVTVTVPEAAAARTRAIAAP
jgi:hypothetical protein